MSTCGALMWHYCVINQIWATSFGCHDAAVVNYSYIPVSYTQKSIKIKPNQLKANPWPPAGPFRNAYLISWYGWRDQDVIGKCNIWLRLGIWMNHSKTFIDMKCFNLALQRMINIKPSCTFRVEHSKPVSIFSKNIAYFYHPRKRGDNVVTLCACLFVCLCVCAFLCLSRCLSGRYNYEGLVPHKQYFAVTLLGLSRCASNVSCNNDVIDDVTGSQKVRFWNFITRDSDVIMFSPCVVVCSFVCLCVRF